MSLLNTNVLTSTLQNFMSEVQKNYSNPTELFNTLNSQDNTVNKELIQKDKKHKKQRVTFL